MLWTRQDVTYDNVRQSMSLAGDRTSEFYGRSCWCLGVRASTVGSLTSVINLCALPHFISVAIIAPRERLSCLVQFWEWQAMQS
ncbi:hypothetical protein J6590_101943 [Homalodisca vitripennis]|nr:hypothetical protein J6590_101943 [Homalodisca vitripennis]